MSDEIEEKRGPGRPKIEDRLRRSKIIAVRVTESGYRRVGELAKQKGMSTQAYLRHVLKMLCDGTLLIR